jgi:translation elongation factor EF-1alpha
VVNLADVRVGKITHYYDKIGVAVIELEGALSEGDKIRVSGHGNEFTQDVASMQIEHENIKEAKKGDAIGLKVDQPVKEGDEVFKVSA